MKLRNIIFSAAVILACVSVSSCEYEFEIDDSNVKSKLFINCFLSNDDYAVISLYVANPVNSRNASCDAGSASVLCSVNGESREVKVNEDELQGIPAGMKYVSGPFAEGDRIRLEASLAGLGDISAETVVPSSFPAYTLSMRRTSDDNLLFEVVYDDEASGSYYGIQIVRKVIEEIDGRVSEYVQVLYPLDNSDKVSSLASMSSACYINYMDGPLIFWDNSSAPVRDGRRVYRVSTSYMEDREGNGSFGGEAAGKWTYEYMVRLYKLSAETFRYFSSLYSEDNNAFASMGLSPAYYSYTNVEGGMGVVGALNRTESAWMKNVE